MHQSTSIFKLYFTLFVIFFLTACGGGSAGDTNESKSTPPNSTSPQYSLTKPNYTGLSSKFEIAPFDAPKVILEITSGLDLLSSLIYGETNHQISIFPIESNNNTGVDIACSSGSEETIEVVKDKHLTVKYDNCVKEGIKLNGTTDVHIVKLIAESALHDMDIISNLSITDLVNDETISMSGYMKIRKSLSDGTFSSTVQFLLEDNGEQIYFDDLVLKESNNFNQLGYKGDIYLSSYGLISINTLDMSNKSQVMEVESINSFEINIALQETIFFAFNNETIPVTINLSDIPDTVWDNINESPTAKITANSLNGERNTTFELSSFESTDPDLEPLYYSWSIISKPIDSIATISQESISSFVTDLPGDYIVQLSVTDSAGNTDIVTEGFYVAKGSPIVAINESATSLFIDEEYSALISHSNDQYDAPIYYRLAYGPAGMTVDSSGQISWTAHVPDFSQTLEVNFAIDAFNTDKIITLERTLSVESLHKNEVHTLLTPYEFSQNADWGRNNHVFEDSTGAEHLIADNGDYGVVEYYLDDENKIAVSNRFTTVPASFKYRGTTLLDNEVIHFFVTENINNTTDEYVELWILNDKTKALDKVNNASKDLWKTITFKDMNNDGKMELIGHGSGYSIVNPTVFSLESHEKLYEATHTYGNFISFCDVDKDGIDELITERRIYSIKNDEILLSFDSKVVEQINTTDSNDCTMLAEHSIEDKSLQLLNWIDGELISTALSEVITTKHWFDVNLDANNSTELVYYNDSNYKWTAISINSTGIVTTSSFTRPDEYTLKSVFNVLDLNGDGIDEFLVGKYIDSSIDSTDVEGVVSALSISNGSIITKYTETKHFIDLAMNNHIAEFTGDNVTAYKNYIYDPSRQGTFNKNGDSETSIITDNGIGYNYDEVIATNSVNGELYYYAVGGSNDERYIAKYGKSGNLIWLTYIEEGFDNNSLDNFQVKDDVVLISAKLILNDINGIAYLRNDLGEGASNSYISPSNFEETLIVDTYNKKVLTVKNNELVVLYDATENNWGIGDYNVNKVDFIQFDEDPQIEIVIYPNSDNKYYILDSINWELEEFPVFTDGNMSVYSVYFDNSDSVCFNHDLKCRNTLLRAETISMVDKLSGKLVWSAPISIGQVSNIKFYTHPSSHIATAIGGVGLKIFD